MPDHRTRFDATGGGLVLTSAILLYRGGTARPSDPYGAPCRDVAAFASIHAVEHDEDGCPTIAAGVSLSRARLRQWSEALGRTASPELLPANILVAHADMLAWWTPAQVRPGYFALSSPPADLRVLSERTIVPVPYPAHLFVATRSGLGVYALPTNERPVADTELRHSPILNVFADGRLCWGDIARPKTLGIAAIADFERAVFDSWSTHPNPGQDLTITGKGGLVRLWDELAARKAERFPVRRLRSFQPGTGRHARRRPGSATPPLTVATLIARSRR